MLQFNTRPNSIVSSKDCMPVPNWLTANETFLNTVCKGECNTFRKEQSPNRVGNSFVIFEIFVGFCSNFSFFVYMVCYSKWLAR